jgi:hypothetical protein
MFLYSKESFANDVKDTQSSSKIDIVDAKVQNIPVLSKMTDDYKIYKFMNMNELIIMISSFDETHISETLWKDVNKNDNIKINSQITKEVFPLNPLIKGYNIFNVIMTGNNITYNTNLNTFTILYMLKVKNFANKYNYLFELKCKSLSYLDDETQEKKYFDNEIKIIIRDKTAVQFSEINKECKDDKECSELQNKLKENINIYNTYYFYDKDQKKKDNDYLTKCLKEEKCKKNITFDTELDFFNQLLDDNIYHIDITIGKDIFTIYNVNSTIFQNDVVFISLILKDNIISFNINDIRYEFTRKSKNDIIVDDSPFFINSNGGCDIVLYSFAIFNKAIDNDDIKAYRLYNYHYLYGANKMDNDMKKLLQNNKELVERLKTQARI